MVPALLLQLVSGCAADRPAEPEVHGPPTRLEVACAPTDNALRFTCNVAVEPSQPVEVRFTRGDGAERTHPSDRDAVDHAVPVYFLAGDSEYEVTASAIAWPDRPAVTTFVTGRAPIDTWLEVEGTPTMALVGTELPCADDAVAVVYDAATGELVWYEDLDPFGHFGLLNMVRFTDDHTVLGETGNSVVEVDLLGNDLARFEHGTVYDEILHHDLFMWNDRYYLLYQSGTLGVILDGLLVLDRDGAELARWRAAEHLELPPDVWGDWMHTNTVYVDRNGDITLSVRTQSTVLKLDGDLESPTFGDPIWTLAGDSPSGLGSTIEVDWSRVSGEDGFADQHNVHLRDDGRWMMLDNLNGRALVLSLDEAAGSATVDAAYPTGQVPCGPQGTAMETAAGNPLVGCFGDTVQEYDLATGEPIWEATVGCAETVGAFGTGAVRWYPLDGW